MTCRQTFYTSHWSHWPSVTLRSGYRDHYDSSFLLLCPYLFFITAVFLPLTHKYAHRLNECLRKVAGDECHDKVLFLTVGREGNRRGELYKNISEFPANQTSIYWKTSTLTNTQIVGGSLILMWASLVLTHSCVPTNGTWCLRPKHWNLPMGQQLIRAENWGKKNKEGREWGCGKAKSLRKWERGMKWGEK